MVTYRIRVAGTVGPAARAALRGLDVDVEPATTAMTAELDQVALHRVLEQIQALGMELVDLEPSEEGPRVERNGRSA